MQIRSADEFKSKFKRNQKTREIVAHSSKVHSVAWNSNGKKLASGSYDKTAGVYSLGNDRLTKDHILKGHTDSVDQLCWHPSNPDLLATASGDKSIRIWDTKSYKPITSIPTKGENINICWSPDGKTIAVGNKDDLVTFVDSRTYKVKAEKQFKYEVNELTWNKESDLFFFTNGEGHLEVINWPELEVQHIIQAHPANCICIEFSRCGKYFATGSADALVSIWDAQELACIKTFSRLEWPVRTISFSYDSQLLASGSEDLKIDIGHVESTEKVAEISVDSPTFTVAWHPSLYLLAYACDDKDKYERDRDAGNVRVWGFPSD
jgi:THO complex subunit 3